MSGGGPGEAAARGGCDATTTDAHSLDLGERRGEERTGEREREGESEGKKYSHP